MSIFDTVFRPCFFAFLPFVFFCDIILAVFVRICYLCIGKFGKVLFCYTKSKNLEVFEL